MTKRKGIRLLAALALCFTLCISFTVPAFAYADDTEQELPITEAIQPEATPETAAPEEPDQYEGEPIDGEGNAYTRDLLYDKATNKQFITVQTKTGNTFYVVIDYDAPINEEEEQYQTYFLNMVDEADLLALLDEETASSLTTCNCDTRCEAGAVNTECPVCKTNMSECTGAVPEPEEPVEGEETEVPEEPENASPNIALIIGIIALVGIGGGAYYYFKFVRGKKQKDEDLDFFDDEGYPRTDSQFITEDKRNIALPVRYGNVFGYFKLVRHPTDFRCQSKHLAQISRGFIHLVLIHETQRIVFYAFPFDFSQFGQLGNTL